MTKEDNLPTFFEIVTAMAFQFFKGKLLMILVLIYLVGVAISGCFCLLFNNSTEDVRSRIVFNFLSFLGLVLYSLTSFCDWIIKVVDNDSHH